MRIASGCCATVSQAWSSDPHPWSPHDSLPILVGGEWRQGRGATYASHYPADGSVNAELAAADLADANEAIETAGCRLAQKLTGAV